MREASASEVGDLRPLHQCVVVVLAMIAPGSVGSTLPPRRFGHHEVDLAGTALGTYQPLTPVEDRSVRTISASHLGGVRLDPTFADFAPDD